MKAIVTLVVFLGRSIQGIVTDAVRFFPDAAEIVVVSRDDDSLAPPAGLTATAVSQFKPQLGHEYILVANGGTAAQLAPVLLRLARAGFR